MVLFKNILLVISTIIVITFKNTYAGVQNDACKKELAEYGFNPNTSGLMNSILADHISDNYEELGDQKYVYEYTSFLLSFRYELANEFPGRQMFCEITFDRKQRAYMHNKCLEVLRENFTLNHPWGIENFYNTEIASSKKLNKNELEDSVFQYYVYLESFIMSKTRQMTLKSIRTFCRYQYYNTTAFNSISEYGNCHVRLIEVFGSHPEYPGMINYIHMERFYLDTVGLKGDKENTFVRGYAKDLENIGDSKNYYVLNAKEWIEYALTKKTGMTEEEKETYKQTFLNACKKHFNFRNKSGKDNLYETFLRYNVEISIDEIKKSSPASDYLQMFNDKKDTYKYKIFTSNEWCDRFYKN